MFLARALGAGASTTWGMLFGRADVTTNEVTTNEVLLKNALILQGDLLDRKRGREQAMQDMVADLKDKLKSEKRLKTEATDTLEETEELVDGLLKENNHAATCRDSSSHMHAASVSLKAEHDEIAVQAPAFARTAANTTPVEDATTLRLKVLNTNTFDEENLLQLMSELQMVQNLVVQRFQSTIAKRIHYHVPPAAAQPLATSLFSQQQAGDGGACRATGW